MTSVEDHITSYEIGRRPFVPDKGRGKWGSKLEFYLACIGHTFGIETFTLVATFGLLDNGICGVAVLLISVLLFSVPIFFIQSALGQFSSTGCITVFRLSPMFKGIGYTSAALNLFSATIFSIPAAYCLLYLYSSIQYELPWLSCNHTWNSENCTETLNVTFTYLTADPPSSAQEYYSELTEYGINGTTFSWHLFVASILVWICATCYVMKGINLFGPIIKYTTIIAISILFVFFVRSCFNTGIGNVFAQFFSIKMVYFKEVLFFGPFLAAALLGSGWNTILTMASYNDFKFDVEKSAFAIPFITFGLSSMAGIFIMSVVEHIRYHADSMLYYFNHEEMHFEFIVFTHYLGHLAFPHFWSILFFTMLLLLQINSVAVQVFTSLTAIFDEYPKSRSYKLIVTIVISVICCLSTAAFSFGNSLKLFVVLSYFSAATKCLVCFLELMIYVWVYGRIRFLRDVQFLLGRTFASWKFYVIRFITPLLALICIFICVVVQFFLPSLPIALALLLQTSFWLFIPGYMIYRLVTTTGTFVTRWKRCSKPTDWYPVDFTYRNKYESTLGSSDNSQQLTATDFSGSPEEDP